MAVIDVPDRMTLTAPAPDAVATAGVQTVGRRGLGVHYYWLVTHFPIGVVVSEPFPVWDAPIPMNASNYVLIVWNRSAGATDYDLLRTETPHLPNTAGNFALATGLTVTQFEDQGQSLSHYDITGLPRGAPVSCLVHLNNRDYSSPVMEMPCAMKVSTLIFSDGSMQWTAGGGGGGSAPILIAGPGISLTSSIGPPPTITINNTAPSQWANVSGGIAYTGGNVGIGTSTPSHPLEVVATTGLTNMLLRHYYPRAAGFYLSTARGTPAAPLPVQAGDDLGWMGIAGRTSTIDGAEAAAISAMAVTVGPNFLSADLLFWTADGTVNDVSERMRITSQGHVGINNTAPAFKLDVTGDINCSGNYRVNGVAMAFGGASVSTTAPVAPVEGQFWYDPSALRLFVRAGGAWFQV